VKDAIETLDQAIANALRASENAAEPVAELTMLRSLSLRMRKLARAWGRPQCLGFFGPSQAGKSFLVGALLSHELGTLKVLTRTGELDFLEEINPAKGVESTGVVTRFSTRALPAPLQRGDFHCRLMTLEVVLESLATGFLAECTSPSVDPERVERCLRDARLQAGPPASPVYALAWETAWLNLLKKYQSRHPYLNELRQHPELRGEAWKNGIRTVGGWVLIYSLLWGGDGYSKDLDDLARRLVEGLERLGHAEAVEVGLEHVRASSDKPSVIDAACLNALGSDPRTVQVYEPTSGREIGVEPGVLSALIAEVRLPLRPVPGSVFENTDLLDFPGGRALRGINGFGQDELNTGRLEHAIEVYKRGKLTFLFEQFSLDREITALVLCSPGPTKPEAIQLQSQVERWLQIRHGSPTPNDQEEIDRPSLFVALTKFDMSLGALRSDNAKDRWDSRVREACVEFWARSQGSWILNWGAKSRAFSNMFWIRNPYADQMQALSPDETDYAAVRDGYVQSVAVQRFIAQHGDKWAAVEGQDERGLPRSGVPLLASHLRTKLAEDIKRRELLAEGRSIRAELLDMLRSMTPSQDEAEERRRVQENAQHFIDSLKREMGRQYSGAVFGELVNRLTPPVEDVEQALRNIHGTVAPMSIKASDKVKKVLVHMLKWWVQTASERFAESEMGLPAAHVERFVREVCTSRQVLPVLGKAIFPYFSRTRMDHTLIASILQVTVCDSMVQLFAPSFRETPELPVRLSYSETANGEGQENGEIDWGDVEFDDEAPEEAAMRIELVFAGSRCFAAYCENLPGLYLKNAGANIAAAADDPRVQQLASVLRQVEAVDVPRA